MLRWLARAALAVLLALAGPVAAGIETTTLTYEAPTFEVPVGPAVLRGVETSANDASGNTLTRDGRVNVGRVVIDVPRGEKDMRLVVDDDVSTRVALRIETFAENGARLSHRYACATFASPVLVDVDGAKHVLVRFFANDPVGACGAGLAFATRGDLRVSFI